MLVLGCSGLLCMLAVVPVVGGSPALFRASAAQVAGESRRHSVPSGVPESPFEEVEVRLVMIRATVLDGRGEVVSALTPDDFVLEENGIPQTIAVFGTVVDQPLRIAFLLDVSGSMGVRGKLEAAKGAVRRFVKALRPGDEAALLVFADGDVRVESEFSTAREPFLARLAQQEAYGQTAVRDALAVAPELVAAAGPGRKALVLITDGVDNASEMTSFEAMRLAREVQVPVYVLGLTDLPRPLRGGAGRAPRGGSFLEVLAELARWSGGELFPVFSVAETEKAVARVEARLRAQYVIGYHPGYPPEYHPDHDPSVDEPGREFRRIELTTVHRRWRVEARRGYRTRP